MKKLFLYVLAIIKFRNSKIAFSAKISSDVKLSKKAYIGNNVLILATKAGDNLTIHKDANVSGCSIGNNVSLHNNVVAVNCTIGNFVSVFSDSKVYNSTIADYTYLAPEVLMFRTTIGKYSSIGPRVIFGHGDHPTDWLSTSPSFYSDASPNGKSYVREHCFEEFRPILIGNDVWIGANAYIKHGISIGDGAIVGSGAIVIKNVEPYSIVGGVPARHIKFRFDKKIIDRLLEIQWWNWQQNQIKERLSAFKNDFTEMKLKILESSPSFTADFPG